MRRDGEPQITQSAQIVQAVSNPSRSSDSQFGNCRRLRLLIELGAACAAYQDEHLRNLPCKRLQCDEARSFVGAKDMNVPTDKHGHAPDECVFKEGREHTAAVALYFMWYNFGRVHQTLRVTPAMEARVSDHVWTIEEIVALLD